MRLCGKEGGSFNKLFGVAQFMEGNNFIRHRSV